MSEYNDNHYDIMSENGLNDIEKTLIDMENREKNKKKNRKIISMIILALIIIGIIILIIVLKIKDDDDVDDVDVDVDDYDYDDVDADDDENKKVKDNDTNPLIIEPTENYSYCLIFIHGLNDNPEHFQKYFENIYFSKKNSTKLIFLRAPKTDVSYKNLTNVSSWFNIYSIPLNSTSCYDFKDVEKSENIIKETILNEVKMLDGNYNKIIIGGHSQGACLSLFLSYTEDFLLGGVISLCGVLFEETDINKNKDSLKALILHGEKDKFIPISYHNKTIEKISNFSGVERFYIPEEDHFIDDNNEFIFKIEEFLNRTLV